MPQSSRDNSAERWIIRIGGAVLSAATVFITTAIYDMSKQVSRASTEIATIRRELELVSPRELIDAIHRIDRANSPAEIERIMRRIAPWNEVKSEWGQWRNSVEHRLGLLGKGVRSRTSN